MKLTFTGTHSTGKTTLLNELKTMEKFNDFVFEEEITRKLQRQGFDINEAGGDETQQRIMDAHLDNTKHEKCVLDRCSLDGIVYTHYLYMKNQISVDVFKTAFDIFLNTYKLYDYMFYLKPEFEIVDDNVRSTNKDFQKDIEKLFDSYIENFNIKVHYITGSVEDRIKQIREIVNHT